jgi:flagellar motor switch protein FliG
MAHPNSQKLTGQRKAAMLLVLLGEKTASAICRELPQDKMEKLTAEIASIGYIPAEVATEIFREFQKDASSGDTAARGGASYAERLLVTAFGEGEGRKVLGKVVGGQQAHSQQRWKALEEADPQQLAKLVESEHPQTVALLVANLGPKPGSALLCILPEVLRSQVIERMAKIRHFSPDLVHRICEVLNRKIQDLGAQSRTDFAGLNAVAEVLNTMDPEGRRAILEAVEGNDPDLALGIRNSMFTFEDLVDVPDNGLRELVGQVDKKLLAVALKGASDDIKVRMFKCMSSRASDMLKEDMDVIGPVRAREVQKAQQEIVTLARKLEDEGKLILNSEEDAFVI